MLPSFTNTGVASHSTIRPNILLFLLTIWKWFSFPFVYGWDLLRAAILCVRVPILTSLIQYPARSWKNFMDSPSFYLAEVAFLKKYAWLSRRSYVTRFRSSPPRFIGPPGSVDVHTYSLNFLERLAVYQETGVDPSIPYIRRWRIPRNVMKRFHRRSPLYQDPPTTVIDLTQTTLCGPKFTQGKGLIGSNFNIVLIEELGRWPGNRLLLAGRGYSWYHQEEVFIKMPFRFAATPTVYEEFLLPGGRTGWRIRNRLENFA